MFLSSFRVCSCIKCEYAATTSTLSIRKWPLHSHNYHMETCLLSCLHWLHQVWTIKVINISICALCIYSFVMFLSSSGFAHALNVSMQQLPRHWVSGSGCCIVTIITWGPVSLHHKSNKYFDMCIVHLFLCNDWLLLFPLMFFLDKDRVWRFLECSWAPQGLLMHLMWVCSYYLEIGYQEVAAA